MHAMGDEEQSSSIRMKLPPPTPDRRDSIRPRLRLCLTCRALKRWSWPFHNAHPETYDRVLARHRLIQEQLARMRRGRRARSRPGAPRTASPIAAGAAHRAGCAATRWLLPLDPPLAAAPWLIPSPDE